MPPDPVVAMSIARAEQGTLQALGRKRRTMGMNPLVRSQPGLSAVARPETDIAHGGYDSAPSLSSALDQTGETRHQAPKLPAILSLKQRAHQERVHEIDEVRTLHHQPREPAFPRSGFEKLRKLQADRRERDAVAMGAFEAGVASISEDMESRVLEASYRLRDGREVAEEANAAIQQELGQDDLLVAKEISQVEGTWTKLQIQCNNRSRCIQQFRKALEDIEILRSESVGRHLRRLVDDLVSIACRMPDEIERIAEERAFELNGVIIGNRVAHADLLAKMEKEDFEYGVKTRRRWEMRRHDWRRLRHDLALRHFRSDLQAANFTNPPERVQLFEAYKSGQMARHEKRVVFLRVLCSRRPQDDGIHEESSFTTTAVDVMGQDFAKLHEEEVAAILEAREGLARIRDAKLEEGKDRREILRAELHGYGALSTEPDRELCCRQVESVVQDHGLEDFMRKAGGLKQELLSLVQGLRSPDIMYDYCLSLAKERTELILCGIDLESVLDSQGKAAMRRGLVDSVERLRKAPKRDIPSILDVLRRQAAEVASVPGIDPLLASGLEQATASIDRIVDGIEHGGERGSSGSGTGVLSVGSKVSKRSGGCVRSAGARGSRSYKSESAGGSSGRTGPQSQSRASSSRGGDWESDLEIDMPQVRGVQRRLGMLACASELSDRFKDHLRGIRKALEQQSACNVAVDKVVSDEADGELDARLAEHSQLLDRSVGSMDARAVGLHACAERLCGFFAGIAADLEAHAEKETSIDEAGEQRVFDCKEDFRLADEDREQAIKMATDRVRMAANEEELEASFKRAVNLLDEAEESYRAYYATAFAAVGVHPREVAEEARTIRATMCVHLGLQPPQYGDAVGPDAGAGKGIDDDLDPAGGIGDTAPYDLDHAALTEADPGPQTDGADEHTSRQYRAPHGGETDYVVDRGPGEIAHDLLDPRTDDNEDGDANSLTEEEEEACGIEHVSALQDGESLAGGLRSPVVADAPDASALPTYWRGTFVPLSGEQIEALKLEEGADAVTQYLDKRDRRFRQLTESEEEQLRLAGEEEKAARLDAKEEAAKAAKKANKKSGSSKGKKFGKGGSAAETPPVEGTGEPEVDPPSVWDVYASIKSDVQKHQALRTEEIAAQRAEERLVPTDPAGVPVMEELYMPVEDASDMLHSLRDDLMTRTEAQAAARTKSSMAQCTEAQENLTDELEERLRTHWPRKGRTEVGSRQPREGELYAHRQKARRFIRQARDKLGDQEQAFGQEMQRANAARDDFRKTLASLLEGLHRATSVAALQGMEARCKRLVAAFAAEREVLLPKLERFIREEPTRLLANCDDVIRLCERFADGGDYDDLEVRELENLLKEPREEIAEATRARGEVLAKAAKEHESALAEAQTFKTEHARFVVDLSLREGLGQRYGAPRRNAQERLRSLIMRDGRYADTIDRLLDDLERTLRSFVPNGHRSDNHSTDRASDEDHEVEVPPYPGCCDNVTQQLRTQLLSLREALFRRASFLGFLPAPERVDRKRAVPGRERGDSAMGEPHQWEEEEIDPEVTLMPDEGNTFIGALDPIEARCHSETRLLYKTEAKEELLGGNGIPESLRVWLQESRDRALGAGGHCQRAQRRLRGQVERFEVLIAKRPVPHDPSTAGSRAPAAMLMDLSSRLKKAAAEHRLDHEARFETKLDRWELARSKHRRLLRPALGSADRREELEAILKLETQRAAEAQEAIVTSRRELLEQEAAGVKRCVRLVADCFGGVAALLDSVVMSDDLGKLPGDDDLAPKRKGLRRLRKADRAFLKGVQDLEAAAAAEKPVGKGRKQSTGKALQRDLPATDSAAHNSEGSTDIGGHSEGRKWPRRKWKAACVSHLGQVLFAVGTLANARSKSVTFETILEEIKASPTTPSINPPADDATLAGANLSAGKALAAPAKAGKKKKDAHGKGQRAAVASEVPEDVEQAKAVRRKRERETEIAAWSEELRAILEEETFVTTAHRVAVAARDAIVSDLAEHTKRVAVDIQERYRRVLEAELHWETKWKQLVALLISSEAT